MKVNRYIKNGIRYYEFEKNVFPSVSSILQVIQPLQFRQYKSKRIKEVKSNLGIRYPHVGMNKIGNLAKRIHSLETSNKMAVGGKVGTIVHNIVDHDLHIDSNNNGSKARKRGIPNIFSTKDSVLEGSSDYDEDQERAKRLEKISLLNSIRSLLKSKYKVSSSSSSKLSKKPSLLNSKEVIRRQQENAFANEESLNQDEIDSHFLLTHESHQATSSSNSNSNLCNNNNDNIQFAQNILDKEDGSAPEIFDEDYETKKMIKLIALQGETNQAKLQPAVLQGVESYLLFKKEVLESNLLKIENGDSFLYSAKNGYAGACDAIGKKKDGSIVVLDWKTSRSIQTKYAFQLAAYAKAVEEISKERVTECWVVKLETTHTGYSVYKVKDIEESFRAFTSALSIFNIMNIGSHFNKCSHYDLVKEDRLKFPIINFKKK